MRLRKAIICAADRRSRSVSSRRASPPLASRSRMTSSATVVFPEPDSPTRPTVRPRGARVEARPAGEQRARIRVARRTEYALRRAAFAHLALAHHHHVVGDLADQPEVVADEQHAHAVALAQPRDQLEHLTLYRDVE